MSYLKHKPGSIEEMMANQAKKLNDNAYKDMFKKELEKAGRGIGAMSPKEKKDFFNKIDDKYKAKNEEEVSKKDVDKFHTSLDKLVHKSFGHSSDEKKKEVKEEDAYDKDDEKPKSKPKKEAVDNPYAVGMAAAMKAKDDKPPLKKSTITKAHDISKSIEKDQKESVEIKEANITLHDHDSTDKEFKDLVKKSNLTMKVKRGYKGDDVTLSGNPMNIEKMLKTMYGNDWSKTYKRRGNEYIEAEYKAEENEYQKLFKKELEKSGKSIASMSDSEKKDFFNKIDTMYKGKNEELTAAQKKLPPALQKAIKDKEDKKEEVEETHSFHKVKQNKKQTQADGEKEIIDPNPKLKMEDVIKSLWEKAAE